MNELFPPTGLTSRVLCLRAFQINCAPETSRACYGLIFGDPNQQIFWEQNNTTAFISLECILEIMQQNRTKLKISFNSK